MASLESGVASREKPWGPLSANPSPITELVGMDGSNCIPKTIGYAFVRVPGGPNLHSVRARVCGIEYDSSDIIDVSPSPDTIKLSACAAV